MLIYLLYNLESKQEHLMSDKHFTLLNHSTILDLIPNKLNNPFDLTTPEICKIAAKDLQKYIIANQANWIHNFGTETNKPGTKKGKMFGVLVVKNKNNELGYISAFSGKLDNDTFNNIFVPSLFDPSVEDFFLDKGMTELSNFGKEIELLKDIPNSQKLIKKLKMQRKNTSISMQQKIFDQYFFLNKNGNLKSLYEIFKKHSDKKPAAGAGECAAPKLFHYAFKYDLTPLAIAEFWWGETTKSNRRHLMFYPACNDKCRPILGYMLNLQ